MENGVRKSSVWQKSCPIQAVGCNNDSNAWTPKQCVRAQSLLCNLCHLCFASRNGQGPEKRACRAFFSGFFSTESSPEIRTALSAVSPAVLGYSDRGPAPNHLPHGTCGAAVPVPLAEATSVNPLPQPPKAASGPCTPHPKRWLQGKRIGPPTVEKRRQSSPGCLPPTGTALTGGIKY